jgi:hypothetical protein
MTGHDQFITIPLQIIAKSNNMAGIIAYDEGTSPQNQLRTLPTNLQSPLIDPPTPAG